MNSLIMLATTAFGKTVVFKWNLVSSKSLSKAMLNDQIVSDNAVYCNEIAEANNQVDLGCVKVNAKTFGTEALYDCIHCCPVPGILKDPMALFAWK